MSTYNYYVYITTNQSKTTLYIGVTNNLARRLEEHCENRGNKKTFAGKYHCYNLVCCEVHKSIEEAINREKEIKKWRREKRKSLSKSKIPDGSS